MKVLILFLLVTISFHSETYAQSEFNLNPSQNMLMTGKGAGQDGAINPFYGEDCVAVVENLDKSDFSVRIQQNGEIIRTIPVGSLETKRINLLKGQELYIDTNTEEVNFDLTFEQAVKSSEAIDG
jgi:hypothetical protein